MKNVLPQASAAARTQELTPAAIPHVAPMMALAGLPWSGWTDPVLDYCVDACQRWSLTLDVLRQRGNSYLEQKKLISPAC